MPVSLTSIKNYLDAELDVSRFPKDQNGIYRASSRPVQRLGVAIEPWATIGTWVREQQLDALFLHRPWRLDPKTLPENVGILAYHLSFDLTLTTGFNPRLATALHMSNPTPFAYKEGIPYGMFGDIPPSSLDNVTDMLTRAFGDAPLIETRYAEIVQRLAIVGAMTDAFIREAATHATDLYITGQFRQSARRAVQETYMNVAIIGHATGEQWGLHALEEMLRERWPELAIVTQ